MCRMYGNTLQECNVARSTECSIKIQCTEHQKYCSAIKYIECSEKYIADLYRGDGCRPDHTFDGMHTSAHQYSTVQCSAVHTSAVQSRQRRRCCAVLCSVGTENHFSFSLQSTVSDSSVFQMPRSANCAWSVVSDIGSLCGPPSQTERCPTVQCYMRSAPCLSSQALPGLTIKGA